MITIHSPDDIARVMRSARAARSLTQQQVADAVGVGSARTVGGWERGRHLPTVDVMLRWMQVVGVTWTLDPHDSLA